MLQSSSKLTRYSFKISSDSSSVKLSIFSIKNVAEGGRCSKLNKPSKYILLKMKNFWSSVNEAPTSLRAMSLDWRAFKSTSWSTAFKRLPVLVIPASGEIVDLTGETDIESSRSHQKLVPFIWEIWSVWRKAIRLFVLLLLDGFSRFRIARVIAFCFYTICRTKPCFDRLHILMRHKWLGLWWNITVGNEKMLLLWTAYKVSWNFQYGSLRSSSAKQCA